MQPSQQSLGDHPGYDTGRELLVKPLAGVILEPKASNPGTAISKASQTIWLNSADGHAYRGAVDLESVGGGGLVYGTPDVGPLLVFKSSTEVALSPLSIDTTGGLTLTNMASSHETVKILGNHSAYFGEYNGGSFAGSSNTSIGCSSMTNHSAGSSNTSVGSFALFLKTSGQDNTGVGSAALQDITTGSDNIAVGRSAGFAYKSSESSNIVIGSQGVIADANTTRLGTAGTHTRTFISGITGVTTGGAAVACLVDASGQLGTISSSAEVKENIRDIEDTSFLHSIQIKNFEYKNGTVLSDDPDSPDYNKKQKQAGVIAEEIELLKPELVLMQGNGVKTVDYHYLFVCALREIQKLTERVSALESHI